jgi:hypothetical protein
MTLRPIAAALLAASALAVAACGADEETPATGSQPKSEEELREAQVKFARCMREQGIDVPDPAPGGEGGIQIKIEKASGVSPEDVEAAEKACAEFREAIRPQLSEAEQAEFKAQALENARCMREHGIDFPDPTFSAEGGAQIRFKGRVDPEDPDFQAAQEACGGDMRVGPKP